LPAAEHPSAPVAGGGAIGDRAQRHRGDQQHVPRGDLYLLDGPCAPVHAAKMLVQQRAGWIVRSIPVVLLWFSCPALAQTKTLKLATLAPDGTTWTNGIKRLASMVTQGLSGQVKVKLIANGIAGDEQEMIEKIRHGQLSGAALTSLGLSRVSGAVHVLELPLLVRNYDELDYLREQLDPELRKDFEAKGFVILAWADLGPVHLFSTRPLRTHKDMSNAKAWVLPGDKMVPLFFEALGLKGVRLAIGDVNAALEKGTIDIAYGSALTTLALGWHAHLRYMIEKPFTFGVAATVLSKREFDALTPDQQLFLLVEAKSYQRGIIKAIRDEDARALETLLHNGVEVVRPSPEFESEFAEAAKSFLPQLEPLLFATPRLRQRAEGILADYRSKPHRNAKTR
jgi:TRAP-type C4-dicarboxylate transport system substrate-binding protein